MWRQCAFTCGHTGATWRIRLNLCFLRPTRVTIQTANRSVRPFLHISRQKVPILTMGYSFPQNCPSDEVSGPPSNTWFPGPTQVLNPNGISIGSAVFAQMTAECPVPILYNGMPLSPPQNCPFPWGDMDPHLIHGSLAHPSPQPKWHLDRFSHFITGLTNVTDQQTMLLGQ